MSSDDSGAGAWAWQGNPVVSPPTEILTFPPTYPYDPFYLFTSWSLYWDKIWDNARFSSFVCNNACIYNKNYKKYNCYNLYYIDILYFVTRFSISCKKYINYIIISCYFIEKHIPKFTVTSPIYLNAESMS